MWHHIDVMFYYIHSCLSYVDVLFDVFWDTFQEEITSMAPFFEDIRQFLASSSGWASKPQGLALSSQLLVFDWGALNFGRMHLISWKILQLEQQFGFLLSFSMSLGFHSKYCCILKNNSLWGDFVGAMHMNLQADNAYLWYDDAGDLDVGIFDWCPGYNNRKFQSFFWRFPGSKKGPLCIICTHWIERY